MRNIKCIIEYDGKNYSGFQIQKDAVTIQLELEKALKKVTKEDIKIIASGRTDKGVHALGQVINFFTKSKIPANRFITAINRELPSDIKVRSSKEVPLSFHSRFDAKKKRYKYIIYNGRVNSPIYRNFSWHIIKKLDIKAIESAIPYFLGTHDFASFMGPKTKIKDSIRTIYKIELKERDEFLEFTIEGNNFLRHMVRIIVGTLISVGTGKIEAEDIKRIIEAKNRSLAGVTAQPQGLFLEEVYYDQNLLDIDI